MKSNVLTATLLMALATPMGLRAEDEEPKASSTAPAAKTETAPKQKADEPSQKRVENKPTGKDVSAEKHLFIDNKGNKNNLVLIQNGEKVVAVVTPVNCTDGTSCIKTTLLDKKITDPFSDIEAALRESMSKENVSTNEKVRGTRPVVQRRGTEGRSEITEVQKFRKQFRDDLETDLSLACDLDFSKSGRSRDEEIESFRTRRYSEPRVGQNLQSLLAGSPLAGFDLPKPNPNGSCASRELSKFMKERESDLLNLEIDPEYMREIAKEIQDLRQDLRDEDSPSVRAGIEKELKEKEEELRQLRAEATLNRRKIQAADAEVKSVLDAHILRAAAEDVAASPNHSLTHLHDLATSTPEVFRGVRESASRALLSVYRIQAQSQLALRNAAARTQDPAMKTQLLDLSNSYTHNGLMFNSNMMNPQRQNQMFARSYESYLNTIAVNPKNPTVDEVREAQAYAKSVLNDIYSHYTPGAQQITNYLTNMNGQNGQRNGGVQPMGLPDFMTDPLATNWQVIQPQNPSMGDQGQMAPGLPNNQFMRGIRMAPGQQQQFDPRMAPQSAGQMGGQRGNNYPVRGQRPAGMPMQ
ncbi:MAG: hypothetical protein ACK5Y2_13075 [Bdellovibrionales bacterium]